MNSLLPLLIIYLQFSDLTWAIEKSPYCFYNKTLMVNIKVNKTREVKIPKPWYKKLSKPTTTVEYYEEEETVPQVKFVRSCCEGYEMSALQLCEPTCSEGCPDNSKCVEPEVCKCKSGYFSSLSQHDRKHYCEPICTEPCPEQSMCVGPNNCACGAGYILSENKICKPYCPSGCPFGGSCIQPNYCLCAQGYKADKGSCIPICSLGDSCKNGECVGVNRCRCNFGYSLDYNTHKCELNLAIFEENFSTEEYFEYTTENYSTGESFEYTTERTTEMYFEVDINKLIADADFSLEPYDPFEGTTEDSSHKCPDDFVLYRGHCQPLKFALDEIDCRLEPCTDLHSNCTENGTCACHDGYRWFKRAVLSGSTESKHHIVKPICLTLEEYETSTNRLLEQVEKRSNNKDSKDNKDSNDNKDSDENQNSNKSNELNENKNSLNFAPIVFIVLGVLVMTSALVYLGLRLVRTERGQHDVEGKQLSCAYVTGAGTDAEKTTI